MIKKVKSCMIVLLFIIGVFCQVHGAEKKTPHVLIGLKIHVSSVKLGSTAWCEVSEEGKEKIILKNKEYQVKASQSGITIDTQTCGKKLYIKPVDDSFIMINNRRYRGTIIIARTSDGLLSVINNVSVDDYVQGVLKHEISAEWPMDGLKAHAIISRTYALKNGKRHESDGFQLCAEAHCQVYGGVEAEDPRIDRAVKETKGMVLMFEEKMAQTVFFSNCGGHTEKANHVWNISEAPPYLQGVQCPYCSNAPRHIWKETISQKILQKKLSSYGIQGKIKSIKLLERYSSGRSKQIRIVHKEGKTDFNANQFRIIIGPHIVRSTYITSIKKNNDGFEFSGKGWGHGVGLCQWGAKGLAERGKTFKQILYHYYPSTAVKIIY